MARRTASEGRSKDVLVEIVEELALGVALAVEVLCNDDTCTNVEEILDEEFQELIIVAHAHVFLAFCRAVCVASKSLRFIECPKEGLTLASLRQHLITRNARVFLADVYNRTTHEVQHIFEILVILLSNGKIECRLFARIFVVGDPLREILLDTLEILHTILCSLERIVAEVFSHHGRIDEAHLLTHEAEVGLLCLLVGPSFDSFGFFVELSIILGEETIVPLNSVVIVDTEFGRRERDTAVARLRDVVVACIVHDRRRGAILLGEGA